MDWFSWLSRTALDADLVYSYGVAFAQNELEEDDIAYFNHEFLQSMGISVAKHRLEILNLSRKQKPSPRPMSRLLFAIRRSFSKHVRAWTQRPDSRLAIVPVRRYSSNNMAKRSSRAPLLLTSRSSSKLLHSSRISSFSSPLEGRDRVDDGGDGYWPCAVEDVRWDAMFHNLKPT